MLILLHSISVWLLPIIIAMIIHEMGKAYTARYLGDRTAETLGRLSPNPFCYIDPIGSILVPLIAWIGFHINFGWGRAVPISRKMLGHPREMRWIALGGILANVAYAALVMSCAYHMKWLGFELPKNLQPFIEMSVQMSLTYAILQCIPIPPLDGQYFLESILPKLWSFWYQKIGRLGLFLIGFLIYSHALDGIEHSLFPMVHSTLENFLRRWIWM